MSSERAHFLECADVSRFVRLRLSQPLYSARSENIFIPMLPESADHSTHLWEREFPTRNELTARITTPEYLLPKKPFSPYYLLVSLNPMRLQSSIFAGLILLTALPSALAQGPKELAQAETEPAMIIHLVDGRRMRVDDVRESAEGFWYRNGTLTTLLDKSRVKRIEQVAPPSNNQPVADSSSGSWSIKDSHKVENFFASKFQRRLPTTAFGQSPLHTRWGLDHRQGIDVGLHPDSLEGRALVNFLRTEKIPFLSFRGAMPGVATGPHIHIGRGSHRTSSQATAK